MYGNYFSGYPQMYGAVPDALGQYKAQYQQPYQQAPAQMPQTAPSGNDVQWGQGGAVAKSYAMALAQAQQNLCGVWWVQGISGAKSFCVEPGKTALLMDSEAPIFYLKTVEISGKPLPIRIFDFNERIANESESSLITVPVNTEQFVTREEFEKVLKKIEGLTTAKKSKTVKEDTEDAESIV